LELKDACGLTDGNLNRHLKALDEANAIRIRKAFVGVKPRTTVYLSKQGLARFGEYLDALEEVLRAAQRALPAAVKERTPALMGRTARA
ncbi:MAG: transcriptional regulator, partial [Kiritimatiellae bacterium]|nr:transcriptional regulator [Kiritimatiellia bacterium]